MLVVALLLGNGLNGPARAEPVAIDPDRLPPTDWLSFAQGALPVSITTFGAGKRAGISEAMQVIDGSDSRFIAVSRVGPEGGIELVFVLPAITRFEGFAVSAVLETPSPSQTFFRHIEVTGSVDGPWQLLVRVELSRHPQRAMLTLIPVDTVVPVRWVKVRLSGGLDLGRKLMFYEFSELQGHGRKYSASPSCKNR